MCRRETQQADVDSYNCMLSLRMKRQKTHVAQLNDQRANTALHATALRVSRHRYLLFIFINIPFRLSRIGHTLITVITSSEYFVFHYFFSSHNFWERHLRRRAVPGLQVRCVSDVEDNQSLVDIPCQVGRSLGDSLQRYSQDFFSGSEVRIQRKTLLICKDLTLSTSKDVQCSLIKFGEPLLTPI